MWKRFTTVVAILAVSLFAFAGCEKKDGKKKEEQTKETKKQKDQPAGTDEKKEQKEEGDEKEEKQEEMEKDGGSADAEGEMESGDTSEGETSE